MWECVMGRGPETLTGGRGARSIGIVSGFVLKLARQATGLTQEELAQALAVDVTTVQSWESGRRPLAAISAGDFLRFTARLAVLGAPSSTRQRLTEAIEADQVLAAGIAAGSEVIDVHTHPLAARVYRRTVMTMITWPITNKFPQRLQEFTPKVPRRGPVASQPVLPVAQRTRFFDHLMAIAQRRTRADETLLRRQAVYLLGFDGREQVMDWLRDEWRRTAGKPVQGGDLAGLLEARSASVALASAGDGARLHDFTRRLTDTRAEIANLNYWAHWVGELDDEQTSDDFMRDEDTRSWTGTRLLQHLTQRLEPDTAHLPLNLHTLHTLVATRPSLVSERSAVREQVTKKLAILASSGILSRSGHEQVSGLQYALRIASR